MTELSPAAQAVHDALWRGQSTWNNKWSSSMTNQHSVTMLSDLIEQLESDIDCYEISTSQALARAYAAGADQQLELDAKWLDHNALSEAHLKIAPMGEVLKEAMRPKPPSLKEQALALLDKAEDPSWDINDFSIVRKALEQLND